MFTSSFLSGKITKIALSILALLSFVGCSSQLLTPPSPGSILYQADWRDGLNGWEGFSQWKTSQGMLINDGSERQDLGDYNTIFAPVQLTTGNYAIIAQMQVPDIEHCRVVGFDLRVKKNANGHGFTTGYELGVSGHPFPGSYDLSFDVGYLVRGSSFQGLIGTPFRWKEKNYVLNAGWHTYRIEANKSVFRFLVDGEEQFREDVNQDRNILTDPDYGRIILNTTGGIGIHDVGCQIKIKSFQVIAL